VVIEAPATTLSHSAQTLAHVAEAAILVVEKGATTAREVADAQAQFAAMRRQVLGGVLASYWADEDGRRSTSTTETRPGNGTTARSATAAADQLPPPRRDPALR
jgi:Mrp family chromosome partitioning ATPase